jgi:hypothetical protein
LNRCQTFSMGLRSGEEGGWIREGIPNFDLAFLASLQVWQGAPSSTTRMSLHLAVLSCLAAHLSGPLSTILTYFSPFIPSPLFLKLTCWHAQLHHIPVLVMSICLLHHKALPICQTCLESRGKPAKRIQTRDTLISLLMVCLSEWRQFRRPGVR